jgi:peptidoglycan/xylan/chitin deacetylase (PgdA/CDA1 family)
MYFVKAPFFLKWLYPGLTWHKSRKEKCLYITFDDGPIPDVTPEVINILKKFDVKATFFCVGDNITRYPEIAKQLIDEGHKIGNHTFNHLKGWNHTFEKYTENVQKCQELTQTTLFRPPYGRATRKQLKYLKKQYEVIMWDVLSGDFDLHLTPQQCLNNVLKHTENGSIIVFHDNIKAIPRLLYTLPRALEQWKLEGYTFKLL